MYGEPYGYGATTPIESFMEQAAIVGAQSQASVSDAELVGTIGSFQVTNAAQMQNFTAFVCTLLGCDASKVVSGLGWVAGEPTIPYIAKTFGILKSMARNANMPELADAITQAAKWFWINVEKPYLKKQPKPKGSLPGLPTPSDNPGAPISQRSWFPFAVFGTVAVGTGLLLYYRRR